MLNLNLQNIHEATEKFVTQQRQEREAVLQVHFMYVYNEVWNLCVGNISSANFKELNFWKT